MQINQVFKSAQAAAEQYLENIRALSGRQEQICRQLEEESADRIWADAQPRIQKLIDDQAGLRELLAAFPKGSK